MLSEFKNLFAKATSILVYLGLCFSLEQLPFHFKESEALANEKVPGAVQGASTAGKEPASTKSAKEPAFKMAGKFGSVIGKVFVFRGTKKLKATKGFEIRVGDRLLSEKNAIAKVLLVGDESFTLLSDTEIEIKEQGVQGGILESTKRMVKGKLHFFTRPRDANLIKSRIETKNAVMGVRGTSGLVEVTQAKAEVFVLEGNVSLAGANSKKSENGLSGSVDVAAGFQSSVVNGQSPSVPVPYNAAKIQEFIEQAQKVSPVLDSHQGHEQSPEPSTNSTEPENSDSEKSNRGNEDSGEESKENEDGKGSEETNKKSDNKEDSKTKKESKLENFKGKPSKLPAKGVDSHLLPADSAAQKQPLDVTDALKNPNSSLTDQDANKSLGGQPENQGAFRAKETVEELKDRTIDVKKEVEQQAEEIDATISIELPQKK